MQTRVKAFRGRAASLSACILVAGMVGVPGAAFGQSLDDKYWIEASGFWADVDTQVRVNNVNHPNIGTTIDLESDLDLADRKVLPAVNAGVKLGRFVIAGEYYALRRSATHSIDREITFDDVVYPVGATVSGGMDSDIYRLTVGYDIVRQKDLQMGLALGGHVTSFDVRLSGQGTVSGSTVFQSEARNKQVLAPLPTLGAYGAIRVLPRVVAGARGDWLSLKIDDYKGRLWNVQAEVTYRLFDNVAIGAAYRYVDYRLDADKEKWNGRISYRFHGPAAVLRIGFN